MGVIFKKNITPIKSIQIEPNILDNIKNIKIFPIYISNKIYDQKQEKIFVIGDAFFTFSPSFAQGASQSIEAAYDLYKMFENDPDRFFNKISKRTKKITCSRIHLPYLLHLIDKVLTSLKMYHLILLLVQRKLE